MHTIVVFTRRSRHEVVLGAWLADAVGRGEKVLVLRAPGQDASVLNRSLAAAGLDPSGVVGSGQVEMLDSARWRAESGGRAQRLYELYLGQVRRAGRDGFPGVAITRDERALRALVRDDVELIAHERDIDRLVADQGVRALCRYPVREGGAFCTRSCDCTAETSSMTFGRPPSSRTGCWCAARSKPATSIGSMWSCARP
jgi:hypothetical protein